MKGCNIARRHPPARRTGWAFTLIELMVVIAIVVILAALLLPVIARAKEKTRRTHCLNNIRQMVLASLIYADDHETFLPSGFRQFMGEHLSWLSYDMVRALRPRGFTDRIAICPNLPRQTNAYHFAWGYEIGYNYLGGHGVAFPGNNKDIIQWKMDWPSPRKSTENGFLELFTDLNQFSVSNKFSTAQHTASGVALENGSERITRLGGVPPGKIGAAGGNIGFLNGSARWRPISMMKVHQAMRPDSSKPDSDFWAVW